MRVIGDGLSKMHGKDKASRQLKRPNTLNTTLASSAASCLADVSAVSLWQVASLGTRP